MARPSFKGAWAAFSEVNVPVASVGKKIGGFVQKNIELQGPGRFENACPIRMSYVLNRTGYPIAAGRSFKAVSGADQKQYLYKIEDMMNYLEYRFGKPDKMVKAPKPSDFAGMKGIIVVKGHGWKNAKGHVTLWNGTDCSDTCHLTNDPDNGPFIPETASIWVLK
jgi:hypothetical protein